MINWSACFATSAASESIAGSFATTPRHVLLLMQYKRDVHPKRCIMRTFLKAETKQKGRRDFTIRLKRLRAYCRGIADISNTCDTYNQLLNTCLLQTSSICTIHLYITVDCITKKSFAHLHIRYGFIPNGQLFRFHQYFLKKADHLNTQRNVKPHKDRHLIKLNAFTDV